MQIWHLASQTIELFSLSEQARIDGASVAMMKSHCDCQVELIHV